MRSLEGHPSNSTEPTDVSNGIQLYQIEITPVEDGCVVIFSCFDLDQPTILPLLYAQWEPRQHPWIDSPQG